MNLIQKKKLILVAILITGFLYFIVFPINIHYASVSFAQNIAEMFESAEVRKFDFYYQKGNIQTSK